MCQEVALGGVRLHAGLCVPPAHARTWNLPSPLAAIMMPLSPPPPPQDVSRRPAGPPAEFGSPLDLKKNLGISGFGFTKRNEIFNGRLVSCPPGCCGCLLTGWGGGWRKMRRGEGNYEVCLCA